MNKGYTKEPVSIPFIYASVNDTQNLKMLRHKTRLQETTFTLLDPYRYEFHGMQGPHLFVRVVYNLLLDIDEEVTRYPDLEETPIVIEMHVPGIFKPFDLLFDLYDWLVNAHRTEAFPYALDWWTDVRGPEFVSNRILTMAFRRCDLRDFTA